MNKYVNIGVFGFLVWLIPFFVSFLIFPLHDNYRPLFESIMPVVLTITVMFFSIIYFKNIYKELIKEGVIIGILWFVISLIIDLIMFIPETPMQMTFTDYMMDIGLTYLIILTIPIGIGYLIEKK